MELAVEKSVNILEKQRKDLGEKLLQKELIPSENAEYQSLSLQIEKELQNIYENLSPWDIVQIARTLNRPQFLDYKDIILDDFLEIHGDKLESDDKALIAGFAQIGSFRCIVIGQQRGKTLDEALKKYNRGMVTPNGYRKARRIMDLAARFSLPLITFVDTPGAEPGIIAEEKGQGAAIAENLQKMSELSVPIITVCIGEGGSGGALALGVGNVNLMLQYAIYSVITPEGAAAILFRDSQLASEAANSLKITSKDLLELKLIDEIIPEPFGGAHRHPKQVAQALKSSLIKHLEECSKISSSKLIDKRLEKYLHIGFYAKK